MNGSGSNMTPGRPGDDFPDLTFGQPKPLFQISAADALVLMKSPDLHHHVGSHYGACVAFPHRRTSRVKSQAVPIASCTFLGMGVRPVLLPTRRAAFRDAISSVVDAGPDEQVIRSYARRVVAMVENPEPVWDRAVCERPREPVRPPLLAVGVEQSVPFFGVPEPTCRRLLDMRPKSAHYIVHRIVGRTRPFVAPVMHLAKTFGLVRIEASRDSAPCARARHLSRVLYRVRVVNT